MKMKKEKKKTIHIFMQNWILINELKSLKNSQIYNNNWLVNNRFFSPSFLLMFPRFFMSSVDLIFFFSFMKKFI